MARYDYGLRGWDQTVGPRRRGMGGGFRGPRGGGYGRDYGTHLRGYARDFSSRYGGGGGGRWREYTPRVTARYNLDYVREQHPGERPVNYHPYAGSPDVPVGDAYEYQRPYQTVSGSRTWRGGGRPVGWEGPRWGYDRPYYPRGRGYDRWF